MEALKSTFQRFTLIYGGLTVSQRLSMTLVVILVVGGLGYFAYNSSATGYVPASYGQSFSPEEMKTALGILRQKGMTRYRQQGSQLLVPRSMVDQYNAVLLEMGGLPDGWASELEKQFEKDGWFPSDRQTKDRKQIALIRELRRIIRALPDIEDASVVWAPSKPKRFSGRSPKVTATINLKPKSGREITPRLVTSLRLAVANMIPDLTPDNVTVFNMRTYESYTIEKDSPFDGRLVSWIKSHTQRYKKKIEQQLSYIPGVIVAVDVQIENLETHIEESKRYDPKTSLAVRERNKSRSDDSTNGSRASEPGVESNRAISLKSTSGPIKIRKVKDSDSSTTTIPGFTSVLKKYLAAMPKAVQVSVGIPEEYFAKVAEKRKGAGGTSVNAVQAAVSAREQILKDVKAKVTRIVGADPTGDAVDVQAFIRVDHELPEMDMPFMETATAVASRWGGPIALGLFAFWALWMVKKNMPKLPAPQENPMAAIASPTLAEEPDLGETSAPEPQTPKEQIQTVVRDNPDAAAAVISQWLRAAS